MATSYKKDPNAVPDRHLRHDQLSHVGRQLWHHDLQPNEHHNNSDCVRDRRCAGYH